MNLPTGLRRWWWQKVRRYDGEICQGCGKPVARPLGGTYWFAPNTLWNRLHPTEAGVYCPRCFTADAAMQGYLIAWVAVESTKVDYGGPLSTDLEVAHDEATP